MRARDIVICAVIIITFVTVINLLTGNKRVSSSLPITRLDHARQESLSTPFHLRAHRLERSARLETADSALAKRGSSLPKSALQQNSHETSLASTLGQIDAVEKQSGLKNASNGLELKQSSTKADTETHFGGSSKAALNAQQALKSGRKASYHVVVSAGEGIYLEWQVRVCYFSYLRAKRLYPDSHMGGFTRLLHSGAPDHLMEEVPTIVVEKLPAEVVRGYQVINRPYAFHQWVHKYMESIPEDYVLMAETDHVFIQPPPMWATPVKGAAYPFWYIQADQHSDLISRFNEAGAAISEMYTIGNSPTMLHKSQLMRVVDVWYPLSIRLKNDPQADKELGWILDMYAWSMASAQAEGGPVKYQLHREFMVQPPFDAQLSIDGLQAYIVHLTYGMDYDERGVMCYGKRGKGFHFDKRDYHSVYPPRNITLPSKVNAPAVAFVLKMMAEVAMAQSW